MNDLHPLIAKGYILCAQTELQLAGPADLDVTDSVALFERYQLHNEAARQYLLLSQLIALRNTECQMK